MLRHRSHLALTVWPIALLFVLEIVRLWPSLRGASAFAAASPDTWPSLFARSALSLAFFGAYVRGWRVLQRAAPDGPGPYRSTGCRRLQGWAGGVAWALIAGHLGLQWMMFISSGPFALSHYELLREALSMPGVLALYMMGLGALGLFMGQGFAASARGMGFAETPESSRWLEVGCTFLSAIMLLTAINVLSHFATGRGYWTGATVEEAPPSSDQGSAP